MKLLTLFCPKEPLTAYRVKQLKEIVASKWPERAGIRSGDKVRIYLKNNDNNESYNIVVYYSHIYDGRVYFKESVSFPKNSGFKNVTSLDLKLFDKTNVRKLV